MGAYLRIPIFFPSQIKTLFVRGRKLLGQIFYFWILPLFSGQPPFIREPSFLYSRDHLRYQKGADYYFVFSKQDYDVCKKAGFLEEKLVTVEHPLKSKSRNFLKEKYFYNNDLIKQKANLKILTIMWPEIEIGFKKDNLNLITKEEIREKRLEIVRKIIKVFDGWKFFIKPHPVVKESFGKFQELIETFKSISSQIKVTDPLEPAEEYIEISDVILGMPPVSMTLFTASLQCPEKPIISLDLNKELLGDFYKDSDTIEYIDEEEKFIETIKLIKNGQYKKNKTNQKFEENKGIINILNNILKLKH